jgi:hypothetical protein
MHKKGTLTPAFFSVQHDPRGERDEEQRSADARGTQR